MSAEIPTASRSSSERHLGARWQRLRTSRRQGMLGVAEIAGLAGSALIFLLTAFSYIYFLVPARSSLQALQLERSRLQTQLRNSQELMRHGQDTETAVDKITESLADFENNRLAIRNQGRMALYAELNQLINKNGLRNTSGPAYIPLDTVDGKRTPSGSKSASTKWQSVYPGIGVTLTVEGTYQNLRRFLRNLEMSKQFLVINTIEFERATETNTAVSTDPAAASGSRGSLVSLRLDMATYFQRETGDSDSVSNAAPH